MPGFVPESPLEDRIARDPELRRGLAWGEPRAGHPEGTVGRHVAELLGTLDRWDESAERRSALRFLALVHDSLKYQVDDSKPKRGENHHAMRARRFAERYTDDERLLATIEHHDVPYSLWRRLRRTGKLQEERLQTMIRLLPDIELFLRFVELDGSASGKRKEPLTWLRRELKTRGLPSGRGPA